ncbi:D-amino-acid transaminase [Thiofilum flexile]|uniref:D-amino-acid transaminase n=1 Tax=Thiofilum flexile TaxID=125627 RepID=UPI000371EDB0|nr:D-amino-acid transaminase [Thiofilum flexile]
MLNPERIVYVNGHFLPESQATISIFDRGLLFADSVYEVNAVLQGKLLETAAHGQRLERSLRELGMAMPMTHTALLELQREIVQRNQLDQGMVYTQITRGVTPQRDFAVPQGLAPSVILFSMAKELINNPVATRGLKVLLVPDIRWQRRDIKTTALLAQSLAKQQALDAGMDEAWMVEKGFITEGTSNNAFIVKENKLITRQLSNEILHGITRASLLQIAHELNLVVEERPFTPEEAYQAQEAFISSAATFALPVIAIDGHNIGTGKPGMITQRLRAIYIEKALETAL